MLVSELIDKLKTLPQDQEVYLGDWNETYLPACELKESEIFSNIDYKHCQWRGKPYRDIKVVILGLY